jgi:hypothetical protein
VPGEPLPVAVVTTPAAGVKAFALEETVPAGWTVSAVSHGGEFNASQRRVKWGPFLDATPRTLTFQTTPPAGANGTFVFAGRVSFDGGNADVAGPRQTASSCRLGGQLQPTPGQLTLTTPLGAILRIETSANLTDWVPAALLTNTTGTVEFRDPSAPFPLRRFYRAVLFE